MKTYSELEAAGTLLRIDLLRFFAERVPADGADISFRSDYIKLREPETDEFVHVRALRQRDGHVFAVAFADLDGEIGKELEPVRVSEFALDEMFTLAGNLE